MTPLERSMARTMASRGGGIWPRMLGLALDEIGRLESELAAAKAERDEFIVRSRPGPTEAEDQPVRTRRRR